MPGERLAAGDTPPDSRPEGMGRIERALFRVFIEMPALSVAAIADLGRPREPSSDGGEPVVWLEPMPHPTEQPADDGMDNQPPLR